MKRILLICAFLLALAVQAGAQSKQQQQQPVEVNGLVVDSDDVPIVGATVYIKDEPGIGSITNSEGRFKLTAKLYNTLAVSFMGYETAEQIITSAADVKITLREGNQMEEVVVIGMGTQRKVSVTGAVAVVDTKDLELPATNIVNTLGGRVPGVISIQSSGEPGRNISEFWVRGIGTFGANSGALVLILLLAALGVGGAFAYIKFIKPKQGAKVSADPDDYEFEDEEYENEDVPEQGEQEDQN